MEEQGRDRAGLEAGGNARAPALAWVASALRLTEPQASSWATPESAEGQASSDTKWRGSHHVALLIKAIKGREKVTVKRAGTCVSDLSQVSLSVILKT